MCGRFANIVTPNELMSRYNVTLVQNLGPRWNIAPGQKSLVVVHNGLNNRLITASWGVSRVRTGRNLLINARMETVREKPSFQRAFIHSRCIIPASGWYEWSAPKTPWYVQLLQGGIMSMAGLAIFGADGTRFVVITNNADGDLADIHHRQPLVLTKDAEPSWLGGSAEDAEGLLMPASSDRFKWFRVSNEIGNVGVDHPRLIQPCNSADNVSELAGQGNLFIDSL